MAMLYSANYDLFPSVPSSLWLGAGGKGKGICSYSRPQGKAMKNIFITLFKFPDQTSDSQLNIDAVPDLPPPLTAPSRPTLVRAATSATLIDTDFISDTLSPVVSRRVAESRRKPSTDNLQSTELVDRLRNHLRSRTPAPPVEDGNLDQDAPAADAAPPSSKVRRRKKRAMKKTVRWTPDIIEKEIQANRPATGLERLERFRRLGYSV